MSQTSMDRKESSSALFLRPVDLQAATDIQPGGRKVGQVAKSVTGAASTESLAKAINSLIEGYGDSEPCMGILFDTFDGDIAANWGIIGAAHAHEAYTKAFCNLYSNGNNKSIVNSEDRGLSQVDASRVVFLGKIISTPLQQSVEDLWPKRKNADVNQQLSKLTMEYGKRVVPVLRGAIESGLATTVLAGGGDRGIAVCCEAVNTPVILLRLDRHFDERNFHTFRSDPNPKGSGSIRKQGFPHSGNGITEAKLNGRIAYDFLLAADGARNNDQCHTNARKGTKTCTTKYVSNTMLRLNPHKIIDDVFEEITRLQLRHKDMPLIINLDVDSLNGVPASAATQLGCIDPIWGCYILEKIADLPRKPVIIRLAELSYSDEVKGNPVLNKAALDWAAESLRSACLGVHWQESKSMKCSGSNIDDPIEMSYGTSSDDLSGRGTPSKAST